MPIEIERRFLVKGDAWRSLVKRSTDIVQGYFSPNREYCVRVRVKDGREAILGLKGTRRVNLARLEFEYPIPLEEAQEMLREFCSGRILHKVRHYVNDGLHTWEIDEFLEGLSPLVIAEVELQTATESFRVPAWLGQEVTGCREYSNQALASRAGSRGEGRE